MSTFKKFSYAEDGRPVLVNMENVTCIAPDEKGRAIFYFVGSEEGVVVSARFDALDGV